MKLKEKSKKEPKISTVKLNSDSAPATSNPSNPGETARHVFENLKKHFEPAKVDEFQAKWLALPENRKKYEKITDAPQVAIEEVLAMTNDLIQYIQGQEGGNSGLLKKIKSGLSSFFKNPAQYVQDKAEVGKEVAVEMKDSVVEKTQKIASEVKDSAKEKAKKVKTRAEKTVKKTVKNVANKTKSTVKKTENSAKKVVKENSVKIKKINS